MNPFEYARPTTIADALALLSKRPGESAPLAGGTDLLSLMKEFLAQPKRVVSLMGIKELAVSREERGQLMLGATLTIDALDAKRAGGWLERWPALIQAAAGIHSPQLRAMGTVAGELLQRPRCWYFRRGQGLLAMKDGKSLVEAGDHRYHAILGNAGPAKFVAASSLAPALVAMEAIAAIASPAGERLVPVRELWRTPAAEGESELSLAPDELLVSVTVPKAWPRSATYEVRPRQGLDWPLVAASAALAIEGGKVTAANVVLGHVAPTPWVAEAAGKALLGKPANAESFAAAAEAALAGATPLPGNAYKVDLAKVAVRRALAAAAGAS